eukprot:746827-Hanusia_phi.AAC.4
MASRAPPCCMVSDSVQVVPCASPVESGARRMFDLGFHTFARARNRRAKKLVFIAEYCRRCDFDEVQTCRESESELDMKVGVTESRILYPSQVHCQLFSSLDATEFCDPLLTDCERGEKETALEHVMEWIRIRRGRRETKFT